MIFDTDEKHAWRLLSMFISLLRLSVSFVYYTGKKLIIIMAYIDQISSFDYICWNIGGNDENMKQKKSDSRCFFWACVFK